MGNFYVNFSVKRDDPRGIADVMKRAGCKAFISPAINGAVVVYEEESDSQDSREIDRVGALLSRESKAPVLAVLNHDDDILRYWLFDDGQVVDSYHSDPDYFGEATDEEHGAVGDAGRLCEVLSVPSAVERVETILRGDYGMAIYRHEELAKALGLPDCAVALGYGYLDQGDFPDELSEDQFIRLD